MAKQSVFAKNEKRKKTVAKYAEKRNRLLEIAKDPKASYEDQLEARQELAKLPLTRILIASATAARSLAVPVRI